MKNKCTAYFDMFLRDCNQRPSNYINKLQYNKMGWKYLQQNM